MTDAEPEAEHLRTSRVCFRPERTVDLEVVATSEGERIVPVFTRERISYPELRAVARLPRKVSSDDEPTVIAIGQLANVGATRTIPNWQFRRGGDETRWAVDHLQRTLRRRAIGRWVLALGGAAIAMGLVTAMAAATSAHAGVMRAQRRATSVGQSAAANAPETESSIADTLRSLAFGEAAHPTFDAAPSLETAPATTVEMTRAPHGLRRRAATRSRKPEVATTIASPRAEAAAAQPSAPRAPVAQPSAYVDHADF